MIIAVASRKASPGVTTLTAWLAHLWDEPGTVRLIVEADASGGTLAARWATAHGLAWERGLFTLSTSRSPIVATSLDEVAQPLAPALFVAPAPPVAEQVAGALSRWGDRGAAELAGLPGLRAFVDCGRLTASAPAITLARRAALTILVCRPRLDEISALVPAAAELGAAGCTLGLVCIGHAPYPPAEVAAAAGIPLLGVLPHDERTAASFDRDGLGLGRSARRSPLVRTLTELAGVVQARTAAMLHSGEPVAVSPEVVATIAEPAVTEMPAPSVEAPAAVAPESGAHSGEVSGAPASVSPAIVAALAQGRAWKTEESGDSPGTGLGSPEARA